MGPLITLDPASNSNVFYGQFVEQIFTEINERWCEETPALYDMVNYIQDEMIQNLIDSQKINVQPDGSIKLVYTD